MNLVQTTKSTKYVAANQCIARKSRVHFCIFHIAKIRFFCETDYNEKVQCICMEVTLCGKTRNSEKIFREINFSVACLFSKTVALTRFSSKKCEREFAQFSHCELQNFYLLTKFPWNDLFHITFYKEPKKKYKVLDVGQFHEKYSK